MMEWRKMGLNPDSTPCLPLLPEIPELTTQLQFTAIPLHAGDKYFVQVIGVSDGWLRVQLPCPDLFP